MAGLPRSVSPCDNPSGTIGYREAEKVPSNIQLIESFSSSCGLDFHNISIDFLLRLRFVFMPNSLLESSPNLFKVAINSDSGNNSK